MSGHELSIFIDESGDFGAYKHHSPFYIISLVFHDQGRDIACDIAKLRHYVVEQGFPESHSIHSAPLIRREGDYAGLDMGPRKKLFKSLFNFLRITPVGYTSFVFRKKEFGDDHDKMVSRISRTVGTFVRDNLAFFQSFGRIVVYYDNGQKEITNLVNSVFSVFLDAEIRKVKPSDYSLFQAADMACTLELLATKLGDKALSSSEMDFFGGERALKKNFLKPARQKKLASPLPKHI